MFITLSWISFQGFSPWDNFSITKEVTPLESQLSETLLPKEINMEVIEVHF